MGFSKTIPPSTNVPGVHSSPRSRKRVRLPRRRAATLYACSVLVVLHDCDGFLHLGAAGLLRPAADPGIHHVSDGELVLTAALHARPRRGLPKASARSSTIFSNMSVFKLLSRQCLSSVRCGRRTGRGQRRMLIFPSTCSTSARPPPLGRLTSEPLGSERPHRSEVVAIVVLVDRMQPLRQRQSPGPKP